MAESNGKALTIARTYIDAMAAKDVDAIMSVTAEDVVCTSPLGQIAGAASYRGFQEGFARMLKTLTVIAAFGDDDQAVVVYKADTHPVADAIVAEHIVVTGGEIAAIRVIYDATPFAAYVASLPQH